MPPDAIYGSSNDAVTILCPIIGRLVITGYPTMSAWRIISIIANASWNGIIKAFGSGGNRLNRVGHYISPDSAALMAV
jgi:hypothetical protein